ncbi:ABC transporter permease [Candidatus Roizmanbacteria bacterium]|nr:ABC transporter permease [Candidatus Roizmanbacteria bacterium]
MSYFIFILRSAIFDFSRNKGRTFLTSLGILIGVLAVVLLLAFGLGLRKYIEQQFESLGTNLLRIVPGQILQGGGFRSGPSAFGTIRFDEKDVVTLRRIKNAEYIIPVFSKTITVSGGGNNETGELYASSADIFAGLNLKPQYGSVFTKEDVNKRSKIVTIGPKIAEKLFKDSSLAVDKTTKIEGQTFRVTGVLEAKGGGFGGPDFDSFIYMPYKTAYIFNSDKKFLAIIAKAEDSESMDSVKEQIIERLKRRYDEDDFSVIEQAELLSAISSIFSIINMVLVSIAAISLVVGGIGIMNIMYVTVTERIKEIGIRRAIGARKIDILSQFLIESIILSLIGGLLGILGAYAITLFIQRFFPAYIDLNSVLLALGVSSAIGIIFGVFPAKKAADLSPIDAIRYE